jgi:hypothetical protein
LEIQRSRFIFATKKTIMTDKKETRRCLNCGSPITGRSDKLFCCGRCKNEWHNKMTGSEKRRREKVFGILWRNYKILELMLEGEEHTPEIATLAENGFRPDFITGYQRFRTGREEFRCFDITYNKTEARLYNIRRAPELL